MTEIKSDIAVTDVRGGGFGNQAWIAKLSGTDDKFGFKRTFCKQNRAGLSRSGRSGFIEFEMLGDGIYEFRKFCVGSTANNWEWSGFVRIAGDIVEEIDRQTAVQEVSLMTPIGFNDDGLAAFNNWICKYATHEITSTTASDYFNAISNFEDIPGEDVIARIEVGQFDGVGHRPWVFDVTRDMVRYA